MHGAGDSMSISVEVGLLSGRTAMLTADLEEPVEALLSSLLRSFSLSYPLPL